MKMVVRKNKQTNKKTHLYQLGNNEKSCTQAHTILCPTFPFRGHRHLVISIFRTWTQGHWAVWKVDVLVLR